MMLPKIKIQTVLTCSACDVTSPALADLEVSTRYSESGSEMEYVSGIDVETPPGWKRVRISYSSPDIYCPKCAQLYAPGG